MAAQDSVLHLLWLLMGVLRAAQRVTPKFCGLWLNLAMMAGQCRLPSRGSRKYSWSCRRLIELELSASYCHALMDLFNMQVVRPVY
jgi:hypothetical protein